MRTRHVAAYVAVVLILGLALTGTADAQRRGVGGQQPAAPGVVSRVEWSEDGKFVSFTNQGQRYRLDL